MSNLSGGTQKNGLPVEVKYFDTIGTHEWGQPATWPSPTDSKWTLEPVAGEVIRLTEASIVFTEDTVIHSGGALVFEFWITGVPTPVKAYSYESINDWLSRSERRERLDCSGTPLGKQLLQLNIPFAQPPVLWSSIGNDAQGNPKVNKMTIRISDNQPYKDAAGVNAALARAKYFAEVYEDPDYQA